MPNLDAFGQIADAGGVPLPENIALTSPTFTPDLLSVYTYTVAANDVINFGVPEGGRPICFDLLLTIPEGAPTFSWGQTITWVGGITPDLSVPGVYPLEFKYRGRWEGRLYPDMSNYLAVTGGTITGDLSQTYGKAINANRIQLQSGTVSTVGSGIALGLGSLAGDRCIAVGVACVANSNWALAQGNGCAANNPSSTAVGAGSKTERAAQLACGQYNASDADALFVVGNGNSTSERANALAVKADGSAVLSGDMTFTLPGGTIKISDLLARIVTLES